MKLNNLKNLHKNKLFMRMMLYFSTMLIPILLVGAVTYQYSTSVMKRDFSNSIKQNLASSAGTIQLYVKTAQETSINFFQNETIQRLLIPYNQVDAEHRTKWHHISGILRSNENIVNDYIHNLFVYIDYDKVYTGEGVEDYDYYFNNHRFSEYNDAFWKQLLLEKHYVKTLQPSELYSASMKTKTTVIPIVTTQRINGANAAMVINISLDELFSTLVNNSIFESTQFVVINDRNQTILKSASVQANAEQLMNANTDAGSYGKLKLGGQPVLVTEWKSDHLGWTYYAITPEAEFQKHSREIWVMTLLTCIIMLLCGAALSLIFSLNLYNPIRTIRNILLETQGRGQDSALKTDNELDYINQRVATLLNDQQNYRSKFERTSSEYLDNAFMQLIKGNPIEFEETFNQLLIEPIRFHHAGFLCCNVQFEFTEPFYAEMETTERQLVEEKLRRILWVLFGQHVPVYVVQYRKHLFACIVNAADESVREPLKQGIEEVIRCFSYDYRYCQIAFGTGRVYYRKEDIALSFNEAMTALEHRNRAEQFQSIRAEDLNIRYEYELPANFDTRITNCLKSGDETNLFRLLKEAVESNRASGVSYSHMLHLLRVLYQIGKRFADENRKELKGRIKMDKAWLDETLPLKERLEQLLAFYGQILKHASASEGEDQGSIVTAIIDYIKNHYRQDIYLETIASEMGVSSSYISRVFKQKTGTNLTEYIANMRMEEAKRLLRESELTIEEIGEQVGISSRTTFIRLFKKSEGTTPSNYRSIHKEQPE